MIDISEVGLGPFSSTACVKADRVLAEYNFHPPGVSGMARLIVAKVCSPDYHETAPDVAVSGCNHNASSLVHLYSDASQEQVNCWFGVKRGIDDHNVVQSGINNNSNINHKQVRLMALILV